MSKTIDECISTDSNIIHEDLILGHENTRALRKQVIAPIIN
jgi:hypothetical protein